MFAVPGWSITAPLKVQTSEVVEDSPGAKHSGSKKRKRQQDKSNSTTVTADNVARLWEEHIEGRKPQSAGRKGNSLDKPDRTSKRRERKRRKQDPSAQSEKAPKAEAHTDDADPQSKPPDRPTQRSSSSNPSKKSKHATPKAASQPTTSTEPPTAPKPALTALQASMRAKLTSARFRHLNEALYTTPSAESRALLDENPDLFAEYHAGFAQQVAIWPENPVDEYVKAVLERGAVGRGGEAGARRVGRGERTEEKKQQKQNSQPDAVEDGDGILTEGPNPISPSTTPLPRTRGLCTIADLGCGTAALSRALKPHASRLGLRLHAFDLRAADPALVTVADIAALPLADGAVDVAILCLALMGTNWPAFVDEAWRVLRWKGELWVAEIKSRFGRVTGGGSRGGDGASAAADRRGNRKRRDGGTLKKSKKLARNKNASGVGRDDDAQDAEGADDSVLAEASGAAETGRDGNGAPETDVSSFVAVLQRRGFVLAPGTSVDKSNKMFVKMSFLKGATPSRGKNDRVEGKGGSGRQVNGGTWKAKAKLGKRDLGDDEELDEAEEAKVLKRCVYKQR